MQRLTPIKAIREKCLDCCGQSSEVKLCPCKDCSLFPYRMGQDPARKGISNKGHFFQKSTAYAVNFERNDTGVYTDIPQTATDETSPQNAPFFTAE